MVSTVSRPVQTWKSAVATPFPYSPAYLYWSVSSLAFFVVICIKFAGCGVFLVEILCKSDSEVNENYINKLDFVADKL